MSAYTVVELIGTSPNSWEDAVKNVVAEAAVSLRHLRVAEVSELDVTLADDGKVQEFRAKVKVSLKHET
jgi:flavin-binding protein dodecin